MNKWVPWEIVCRTNTLGWQQCDVLKEEKLKEKFGIQKKKLDSKEKRGLKENIGIAEQLGTRLIILKEILNEYFQFYMSG